MSDHGSTHDVEQGVNEEHLLMLGQMLVGIAHELNTPIGVVSSVCDSLHRCQTKLRVIADKPEIGAEDLQEMRSILDRMDSGQPVLGAGLDRVTALVRELRQSARNDVDPDIGPVSLIETLEGDLLLLHFQLKQGVTIERHFQAEPQVIGRSVMIGQVFLNLLRNAIQAIDGSGTITLTVQQTDTEAVVTVADDGPGIQADVLDQLFNCAVTTKCPETGTGIGLVNCQKVLEKMGGRITAANDPNGGAVFTVSLPLA